VLNSQEQANIKHFVLNSQENERNSASSNVDQVRGLSYKRH